MNSDFTFSIIKPNAVRTGKTGPILAMINEGGFEISAMRMVQIDSSVRQNHFTRFTRANHFLKVCGVYDKGTGGSDDSKA